MIRLIALVLALPAAAAPTWSSLEDKNGVLLETREVPGSAFEEIRVTTQSTAAVDRVCEAVWGGNTSKLEPGFKTRQTINETPTERWTYERIAASMARDRDYTIHVKREPIANGCRITFETQNDKGPPPQPGAVRIPAIRGNWEVVATEAGGARIVYVVYSEPGGRVPAFLARGGQRSSAVEWMKIILGRLEAHAQR